VAGYIIYTVEAATTRVAREARETRASRRKEKGNPSSPVRLPFRRIMDSSINMNFRERNAFNYSARACTAAFRLSSFFACFFLPSSLVAELMKTSRRFA